MLLKGNIDKLENQVIHNGEKPGNIQAILL